LENDAFLVECAYLREPTPNWLVGVSVNDSSANVGRITRSFGSQKFDSSLRNLSRRRNSFTAV